MSGAQFTKMLGNISRAIDISTPEQREEGLSWYKQANQMAQEISPSDIERGAGLTAALSSYGTKWDKNIAEARHFMKHGEPMQGSKATKHQLKWATRIMGGEHYRDVFPEGLKVRNFADLITNPENENIVVVDTHQADLAGGLKQPWKTVDRGLGSFGRYNTIADAVRTVGQRKGLRPADAQAISWVSWKANAPSRGVPSTSMIRRGRPKV